MTASATAPPVSREKARALLVSLEEEKLLTRLRQCGRQALVLIQLDESGTVVALTVFDKKSEKL